VIPVLFNRLHDPSLDLGGIYLEQIIPDQSRYGAIKRSFDPEISVERGAVGIEGIMRRYLSEVIGQHRRDSRIYAWDLCNTPFGPYIDDYDSPLLQGEMAWLSWLADFVRRLDAEQPLTIRNELDPQALRLTSSLCDLLAFQPYYQHGQPGASQARFEMTVDECLQVANDSGKELLATETVWGSLVDGAHVAIMQYTLQCLKDRGIGWITQSLYHSPVANQHLPSYGPVGVAGYQAFINPDNRLRDGHDAWNRI